MHRAVRSPVALGSPLSSVPPVPPVALEPVYFTPPEFADVLRVSEKTIYRWAATDLTMPVLRIGKTIRFPRERVLAWLRSREQGAGRAQRTRNPSPPDPQPRAVTASENGRGALCAIPCAIEAPKRPQSRRPMSRQAEHAAATPEAGPERA